MLRPADVGVIVTSDDTTRQHVAILHKADAQLSSDGISALGKSHMRSTPFLGSFTSVAFETVSMFV